MKSIILTKSAAASVDRSESRDSHYYPGCRKDTNCHCEICLDSINATLDLFPPSAQRSSLTKLSVAQSTPKRPSISFDLSIQSTPPLFHSTDKSRPLQEKGGRGGSWLSCPALLRIFLWVGLILMVDFGLPWVASKAFRPSLSPGTVKRIGEESMLVEGLDWRLRYVEKKLGEEIHGDVFNCNSVASNWELIQDGLLLVHSRCTLYKSITEEVIVWGWPLQTAGLLMAGVTTRSFTIISGRVTEWSNGRMMGSSFSVRKSNSSWTQLKWSASALQLDPNTWILEYRLNAFFQNSQPSIFAMKLLIVKFSEVIKAMKQEFFALFVHPYHYYHGHDYHHHKGDHFTYCAT